MMFAGLSLLLPHHGATASNQATSVSDVKTTPHQLQTPQFEDRSFRGITLPNKLEVLLIHDPNADFASAAMNVQAGFMNDQNDFQGLAHFCEHYLFYGINLIRLQGQVNL